MLFGDVLEATDCCKEAIVLCVPVLIDLDNSWIGSNAWFSNRLRPEPGETLAIDGDCRGKALF